jgi:hypothetical protein
MVRGRSAKPKEEKKKQAQRREHLFTEPVRKSVLCIWESPAEKVASENRKRVSIKMYVCCPVSS